MLAEDIELGKGYRQVLILFLQYKEIQKGSEAKSYMRKGFVIYEEMRKCKPYMRRPLVVYDFAPDDI
jgi:hypothetical protein